MYLNAITLNYSDGEPRNSTPSIDIIFIYRCLITALHEANRLDLIYELRRILTDEVQQNLLPIHWPLIQPAGHSLDWYGSYLKKQYLEILLTSSISADKWLPSPTQKIFNLAIIKKEKIQRGKTDDEFVHKTIRGKVDDILLQKSPIELKNFFRDIEGERKVILIDYTLTVYMSGMGQRRAI